VVSLSLFLSLQSFAVEQVLDILMDILPWEIAVVVSPCFPRGLWSHIVIRVFLLLGTVCPRHPLYPVLSSCPLSRAFPYPQPGDAGGHHSAPAVCQSLTSADPGGMMMQFFTQNLGVGCICVWLCMYLWIIQGDSRYFISNCKDQTVKLWDMRVPSSPQAQQVSLSEAR